MCHLFGCPYPILSVQFVSVRKTSGTPLGTVRIIHGQKLANPDGEHCMKPRVVFVLETITQNLIKKH